MTTLGGGLAVALACAGASLLGRALLFSLCPVTPGIILFYPAVLLAGVMAGRPGGLLVVGIEGLTQAWLLLATGSATAEACELLLVLLGGTAAAFAAGELRQALDRAEELDRRLTRLEATAGIGEWEWAADGSTLHLSDRAWSLLGQPPEARPVSAGQLYTMLAPEDVGAVRLAATAALAGRTPGFEAEFRVLSTDGTPRWRRMRGLALEGVGGMAGVLLDIDDQKRAEATCRNALARQELIYRELAHRVKNNFQLIASLLRLQSRRLDPAMQPVLEAAVHRLQGMAALHDSLDPGGSTGQVAFDTYLQDICDHLRRLHAEAGNITLTVQADTAILPADRALLLGLAVVELVGNAMRHAFPGGAGGRVEVGFRRVAERYRLWVEDNGVGFEDLEPMRSEGFGMMLVQSCAQQLEGELLVERRPTTRFEIHLSARAAEG
ncbi:MAG TPA: histidine kinase dimerization/phosphoacceptor domain -containing protein [Roseomonas sp.]|nr:histidine kinase dimerization/phosphoacceptor domain -containing protein [Roseomonas sp.]